MGAAGKKRTTTLYTTTTSQSTPHLFCLFLMVRRASFGSASKGAGPKAGFLEKLKQLRSFVGASVGEDDLNNCLKQCGCDVNLAATKLMTGEYSPKEAGKKRGPSAFFNLTKSTSPDRSQQKKPRVSPVIGSNTKTSPKLAAAPVSPDNTNKGYLLCQRWLSAESRSKGGQVSYQETLKVTSSANGPPMVRLSGNRVEGILPRNLCIMLAPLRDFLHLTAESLMEDKRLHIGAQFPINLR